MQQRTLSTSLLDWFKCYLVPGLVFQSVIVGGGYGTGREVVEFFLVHGPMGGLLGMLVSCLAFSLIMAVAFEFARVTKSYDYRAFFQALLGRFWWSFEIIYLLIALLILAVLGSAAGEIVAQALDWQPIYGSLLMMALVGLLNFFGSGIIERIFVLWSGLLYLTYITLLWIVFHRSGDHILQLLQQVNIQGNWALDGVRYTAYNLSTLATVLFVAPRFTRSRQALGAGMLAGMIVIVPGILVFLVLLSAHPAIASTPVPMMHILQGLNMLWLLVLFQTMLFGTFIETGTGIIHAINERIANNLKHRKIHFSAWSRALIALLSLGFATFLADTFGMIQLIAKGYGALSYAYIVVVVIPLLTVGLARILKRL